MSEFAADWFEQVRPYFLEYGFWFVLTTLFLKNIIFLGPFLPGAAVLVAIGWFGRQGQGSIYLLALAAFVGTIAGGGISFAIGRRAGDRLLKSQKWGENISLVSERIRKEPALFVFCHFQTLLRMFVPATAGLSGAPFRRWFLLNAIGAALWIVCYVSVGYFLSLSQAMATVQTIGFVILGLVIVIFAVRYLWGKRGRASGMRDEG